jgi:hypothetical protein
VFIGAPVVSIDGLHTRRIQIGFGRDECRRERLRISRETLENHALTLRARSVLFVLREEFQEIQNDESDQDGDDHLAASLVRSSPEKIVSPTLLANRIYAE